MNRAVRKIAFVSPHCVVDSSNGAALATRGGLKLLAAHGFACEAFCGTRLDEPHEGLIQESLARQRIKYIVRKAKIGAYEGRLVFLADGNLPVTLFENASTRGGWLGSNEVNAFMTGCEIFLRRNRPDLVWTYGGDAVSVAVQHLAKRLGIPVLFTLYNFAYTQREGFLAADCVAVPCEFSRRFYREKLGLACHVLPVVVNWDAALVKGRDPRFLTFINPQDIKGVYVFARIARELARRRPDIAILVTQGRSSADALLEPKLGLASHLLGRWPIEPTRDGRNVVTMPFAPDTRAFFPMVYSNTKLLLMPSLWFESFGLVAAEAMLNGIPVLGSNRGALPETIGDAGFLFDIPARYTPETRDVPSAEEVEPWIETIIRLWDDAAEYDRCSRAARERARQWHPDRLAPIYREFFAGITHQRGPPLVRKEVAKQ